MTPTYSERKELRKQFAKDVDRMLACLEDAGLKKTDDEAVMAWAKYSDDNFAGWLALPEDDATLREILLRYLANIRSPAAWQVTAVAATDGSGDLIIPLPSELSEQLGWKIAEEVVVERGDPDTVVVRRR